MEEDIPINQLVLLYYFVTREVLICLIIMIILIILMILFFGEQYSLLVSDGVCPPSSDTDIGAAREKTA